MDRLLLQVPLLGNCNEMWPPRFARTLGTLAASGLPILDALKITRGTMGNAALSQAIEAAESEVTAGRPIAAPLESSGFFPALLIQVIGLGERTGRLDGMLLHAADAFDRQVGITIVVTKALPPILLCLCPPLAASCSPPCCCPCFLLGSPSSDQKEPGINPVNQTCTQRRRAAPTCVYLGRSDCGCDHHRSAGHHRVPNVFGNLGSSRQKVAAQKAATIRQQISIYLMNNNLSVVPDDFELSELTVGSNAPLRQKDILDPWGREFIVEAADSGAGRFQVVSYGADGEPGGEDENADVTD